MKRKYLGLLILIFSFIFISTSKAADRKEGIESFPESYQPYLYELQKKYPNWTFTALYTNLNWNYVIDNENEFGKNLVPKSYSDRWKNTNEGEYNVEVDSGWVDASRRAVEFAMDPRNFLNIARIFQFENLSYDANTNNKTGIEKILYGTEFYNTTVQYLTSSGSTITMSKKYSDLILQAGQTSKVSSYHLASRIKQEVGPFLSHSSISGNVSGYEGLYNFYNIGATSSSKPMGAIKNGLQYAKDGKGASATIKSKYLIPWNTKERAITGGGIFIGSSYINVGQNTIYLQKFHVTGDEGDSLFWHQYMTNVLAPYSEAKIIYSGYNSIGMLNNSLSFVIPVYNNMPNTPTENPNILESDFKTDNTKVYANVSAGLNVRTGPSTSYDILTTVTKEDIMTRIAIGIQSGELWDKVKLESGIVGYVFHNYLDIYVDPTIAVTGLKLNITNLTLEQGESYLIVPTIVPSDATNKNVTYTSQDANILQVGTDRKITALNIGTTKVIVKTEDGGFQKEIDVAVVANVEEEINFDTSLKVSDNLISGFSTNELKVSDIKAKIQTSYQIKIYNSEGKELTDTQLAGTGSTIRIVNQNGVIKKEYKIVIYGDVSGDGKINSTDLLVLQRHILEIQKLEGAFYIAGNINKNGKNPSSLDSLLIQRHILELKFIEQ